MESRLTMGVSVLFFVMTLSLIGAFFLPWLQLMGLERTYSGVTLIALPASPWAKYFFTVEPLQAAVLIGAPMTMMVFGILMVTRYAQGQPTPVTTAMVLASPLALIIGARGLFASGSTPDVGLQLVIVLAILLGIHQLAIIVRAKLYRMRRFPKVYQILSMATGRRARSRNWIVRHNL